MIRKSPAKNGKTCRVTFEVPAEWASREVAVVGDFTEWNPAPLERRKDGRFSRTVVLPTGNEYRFRYLLDGERWENDASCDRYEHNDFGSEDGVIDLRNGSHGSA